KADINADEIERMAESLMAQQKMYAPNIIAALETLDEHVSAFRESNDSYLNGPVLRSAEEGVDIGRTWLELYQNLYIRLMKLASDRLTETAEGSPVFSDSSAAESYIRSLLSERDLGASKSRPGSIDRYESSPPKI